MKKINRGDFHFYTECPFCGQTFFVLCNAEDYADWQSGTLVQDAFSYLDEDQRELFITGICPTCWKDNVATDEDESDYSYDEEVGFDPYMGCYTEDC